MKRHPAWFAAGLLLFLLLACNLSRNKNGNGNGNANANTGSNRRANAEVYTDEVYTAKSKDGPSSSTFSPSDRTVHVVAKLNKMKGGTDIKFVWIAADVEGETNKSLRTIEYTTKTLENEVSAYLRWPQDWPKGRYKVEVYIDGNLDRTVYYDVE